MSRHHSLLRLFHAVVNDSAIRLFYYRYFLEHGLP
jgi:hypothetical protein